MAVRSAPLRFSPCPPCALQMPPKGSGVSRAQIEEEEKALIGSLIGRLASEKKEQCLPRLPGRGRSILPDLCDGEWVDAIVADLLAAANATRAAQGRAQLGTSDSLLKSDAFKALEAACVPGDPE